jgi:trigger factor
LKTTVEPLEGNRVKVTVTVPASDVDAAVADVYVQLAKQVRVPGFRKGKAPRPIIDTHVGRERVLADASQAVVERTYEKAIDAEGVRPIDQPDLGELPVVAEGEDYTYVAEVEVRPELGLTGDWQKLKITVPPREASEADVTSQIDQLRDRFASLEPVEDRGVQLGDFVLLSFVSLLDGEPYEGNTVDKYLYETGKAQMPQEFEDALIGAQPGDTVMATFTIPESSSNPEYVGKSATFDITVHEIKAKQLPEVDEEFATNAGGFDSVEQMRVDIKTRLDQQYGLHHLQETERRARIALAEHLDGEEPETMVMQRRDNMVRDFFNNLEQRGISLREYVSSSGVDPEKIQKDIEDEARARVRQELALEALFRAEGLAVTDADLEAEIADLAESAGKSPEELRREWEEAGMLAVLREHATQRKAVEWLLDHAEITEEQPSSAEEEPAAKPKKPRKSAKKKEEKEEEE